MFWRGHIQRRRPYCPVCKAHYADDALPGGYLFSTLPVSPVSASVTAFCTRCWNDLPLSVIEQQSARVLRQIIPDGEFIDPR